MQKSAPSRLADIVGDRSEGLQRAQLDRCCVSHECRLSVVTQQADIAVERIAGWLANLLSSKDIGGLKNGTQSANVVMPTPRDYFTTTKVVVFYGIGASPAGASYNLLS